MTTGPKKKKKKAPRNSKAGTTPGKESEEAEGVDRGPEDSSREDKKDDGIRGCSNLIRDI